jgi:hypothetical protein
MYEEFCLLSCALLPTRGSRTSACQVVSADSLSAGSELRARVRACVVRAPTALSQPHRHLDEVVVVELGKPLLHHVPRLERLRVGPQAHRAADEVVKAYLQAWTAKRGPASECQKR